MNRILFLFLVVSGAFFLPGCTKTESDFSGDVQNGPETIIVTAGTLNTLTNTAVSFSVISSVNAADVTAHSNIYVNGSLITGNTHTFTAPGNYAVYAAKGSLQSPVITMNVTMAVPNTVNYKHNVLVEEYSGTWCGNCPRLLYGVELLHQQTTKAVVVGMHLSGGDPFISADGNSLAAQQGVSGVPNGYINRTTAWTGPQYENVPQVINTIQASATTGLAVKSTVSGGSLNITVKMAHSQPVSGTAKLTVYLMEDKLYHTQRNYSANLYNGASTIPNFEYNGVLRKVVSALSGDAVSSTGSSNEKNYVLNIPSNVVNISNAQIVAFVTDASGTVLNVQQAKAGEDKVFEIL